MSERFTKLFTAPENLYAAASPVVIAAGALLKDNQTGKVLAQLKMHNIGAKTIKAATVLIHPFDTVGDPLGGELTYQYLDLAVAQGQDFGAKTPITLVDAATRSFSVTVKEIVFADNSTYAAADEQWEPLPAPVTLEDSLDDAELVKQYRIQYGTDCQYMPTAQRDLWRCTCGEWSQRKTNVCCRCGKSLSALMAVDLTALRAERDARLAAEAEAAAAKKATAATRMKKVKKVAVIVAALLAAGVAAYFAVTKVVIPNGKYNDAVALMDAANYEEAIAAFKAMDGYKDSEDQILECKYLTAEALLEEGDTAQAAKYFASIDWRDSVARSKELWSALIHKSSISTGTQHTVGLKTDGTVVAVGRNNWGQLDVDDWTDIVAVGAGAAFTVGLKGDGTLVTAGDNTYGQLEVADWTDIIEVAVNGGAGHTVGLKADGTVVATGYNKDGQCDVNNWTDIVAIAVSTYHTVGLKADGTVVAVGSNNNGQLDVGGWTDIVAIAAGLAHTVGLKEDGSIVVASTLSPCYVSTNGGSLVWVDIASATAWKNIRTIDAGSTSIVGLKADGTVAETMDNADIQDWTNIVDVAVYDDRVVGLKADGTVVAAGYNEYGECNVSDWTDIKLPE